MRLFAFLRRDPGPRLVDIADQLSSLQARLEALEAEFKAEMHPARLVEWHELAEKLKRYLQRISAVEQRAKDREGGQEGDGKAGARALLMRTKFGTNNGS